MKFWKKAAALLLSVIAAFSMMACGRNCGISKITRGNA